MKYLSKKLSTLLPKKSFYYDYPIIYAYNNNNVICLFSFDKRKQVILISDYDHFHYRYMSVYEFKNENYHFIYNRFDVEEFLKNTRNLYPH